MMPESPELRTDRPRTSQTAPWVIAVLLALIAGVLLGRGVRNTGSVALAQNTPMVGARGVYAIAGQIDRDTYGLFMLDIEQGTMWCYELDTIDGVRKLRLVAGRSWLYDRYLRDFNCAPPSYRDVQDLVSLQRQHRGDNRRRTSDHETRKRDTAPRP